MQTVTETYASILIRDIRATRGDYRAGTEGACGEFALMLHSALRHIDVPSEIGLCCDATNGRAIRDKKTGDLMCLAHFVVKSEGRIFDIRGERSEAALHEEFCTDIIVYVDRAEAERYALTMRPDFDVIFDAEEQYCIQRWRTSLERNCGSVFGRPQ